VSGWRFGVARSFSVLLFEAFTVGVFVCVPLSPLCVVSTYMCPPLM
jgi:hypothetical protein